MSAISSATLGMTQAANRFERAASRQVRALSNREEVHPVDPVDVAADQIEAEAQFKASAAVVRAADAMLGALIDIKT